MKFLAEITRQIQSLNGAEQTFDPEITAEFVVQVPAPTPETRNEMLVMEESEEIWLGLKFDKAIHHFLAQDLNGGNIFSPELGIVSEEVSHLVYAHYHMGQNNAVSALELEVQGEIDRFLVYYFFGKKFFPELCPRRLAESLFEDAGWQDHVIENTELLKRYEEAWRLGKQACFHLADLLRRDEGLALQTVRTIFQKSGHSKLHLINNLKAA